MSQLRAIQVYYVTGVTSFNAVPGTLYRVDTTAAQVTANLPPAESCQPGDWVIIKNISGANNVVVAAYAAGNVQEYVDLTTTNTLSSSGQRREYIPNTAPGFYPTPGWSSF
jgi:hypothetical protein